MCRSPGRFLLGFQTRAAPTSLPVQLEAKVGEYSRW
jgi:hypothetical protein